MASRPRLQSLVATDRPYNITDEIAELLDVCAHRFARILANEIVALTPTHHPAPPALLLTPEEAAAMLNVPVSTLNGWSHPKRGLIPRRQYGKRVLYERDVIERIAREGLPQKGA